MVTDSNAGRTIVYFDGTCGLCNRAVNFLMKQDRHGRLLFSPLQGETAQRFLSKADREDLNTMIVTRGIEVYRRSNAMLEALKTAGGFASVMARVGSAFHPSTRDTVYDWIAENRYKLFGQEETCRLPTPEERARFLP